VEFFGFMFAAPSFIVGIDVLRESAALAVATQSVPIVVEVIGAIPAGVFHVFSFQWFQ
jgi:hypothetical protein